MTLKILSCLTFTFLFSSSSFASHDVRQSQLSYVDVESEKKKKILDQYERWKGVKYKFGGTTPHGIDCSSLVQQIYHSAFGEMRFSLPRATAHQIKQGQLASKSELRVGDLVFFQMSRNERHVGVYIGDQQFVHASTSKGVVVSDLTHHYWEKRYKTARRIIQD